MATKSARTTWTEEEKVRGLNVLIGDGEPAFDEEALFAAWREARANEGTKVEVGDTGRTITVWDDGREIHST